MRPRTRQNGAGQHASTSAHDAALLSTASTLGTSHATASRISVLARIRAALPEDFLPYYADLQLARKRVAMMTIRMDSNIHLVAGGLKKGFEQTQLALAKALTFTAERVRAAQITEMRKVFDRPVPFTLNSLYMRSATPQRLFSVVFFKDLGANKRHYLIPQIEAGKRERKLFERLLARAGHMGNTLFTVPGSGAKIDSHGNWNRGQLIQVLSALKSLPETGYTANRTAASIKLRANTKRKLPEFFVGRPGGGRLPLGVWQRMSNRTIKPILIFLKKAPHYKARFNFYKIGNAIANEVFPQLLTKELARIGL